MTILVLHSSRIQFNIVSTGHGPRDFGFDSSLGTTIEKFLGGSTKRHCARISVPTSRKAQCSAPGSEKVLKEEHYDHRHQWSAHVTVRSSHFLKRANHTTLFSILMLLLLHRVYSKNV